MRVSTVNVHGKTLLLTQDQCAALLIEGHLITYNSASRGLIAYSGVTLEDIVCFLAAFGEPLDTESIT